MQVFSSDQIPDAYKQGWITFYGMAFDVTPDVLIPRPETEMLVNEVKDFLSNHPLLSPTVVDVGTGSGCLAISVAKLFPKAKITAVDLSERALNVAKRNAAKHAVTNIDFIVNDLLENADGNFDVVVANLPYIPHSRLKELDSSVIDFEPILALDGGSDGFDLYRKLFSQLKKMAHLPKLIVCEIDDTHGDLAKTEAKNYFADAEISIKKDFANLDRVLVVLN